MIFYELKKAFFKMFITFLLLFLVISFFLNLLLEAGIVIWFSTIYFILAFGMIYTINVNDKYRNEVFNRQLKMNSSNNFWMQSKLFVIPIIVVFSFTMVFVAILVSIGALGGFTETNFIGQYYPLSFKDGHWGYFIYEITITVLIIVLLSNLFYKIVKNRSFLYAIMIIYLVYYLWFGNLFFSVIQANGKTFSYATEVNQVRLNFNYLFLPWTQVTAIGREIFNPVFSYVNLFNYSGLQNNILLYAAPYFTILFLSILNFIDVKMFLSLNVRTKSHSK